MPRIMPRAAVVDVHAGVLQRFSGEQGDGARFELAADARQFSSFVLLVGTLSRPHSTLSKGCQPRSQRLTAPHSARTLSEPAL